MTPSQRLRQLADRTGLDGFADELRAMADEMDAAAQPAPVQEPMPLNDSHIDSLIEAAIQGHAGTRDAMRWLVRQLATKPQDCDGQTAQLEGLLTDLADAVYHRDVDDIPRIRKKILTTATKQEPMRDIEISLGACNSDPGDWNDLGFRESWHEGFAEGARFAEAHRGITKEQA
jgi:hypothetical protein